jgi:hypothetical protein
VYVRTYTCTLESRSCTLYCNNTLGRLYHYSYSLVLEYVLEYTCTRVRVPREYRGMPRSAARPCLRVSPAVPSASTAGSWRGSAGRHEVRLVAVRLRLLAVVNRCRLAWDFVSAVADEAWRARANDVHVQDPEPGGPTLDLMSPRRWSPGARRVMTIGSHVVFDAIRVRTLVQGRG